MAEPMYFQWQNEVLLKTIYPLREMKLRDFLVYYKEIDLWAEYKDKKIEDLQTEIQEYIAARDYAIVTAYKSYKTSYAYFTKEDVRTQYMAKYKLLDDAELAGIKELHRMFMTYLPNYADVRKEKYFVTQQVLQWEQKRKALLQEIAQKQRRLNIIVPEKRAAEEPGLKKLQLRLAIMEDELSRLYAFVSTYNKIEKRKLELYKAKENAKIGMGNLRAKLDVVRTQLIPAEIKQREVSAALARLQDPPKLDSVQAYFSIGDASEQIRKQFPNVDQSVLDVLNGVRKKLISDLRSIKDDAVKLVKIKEYARTLQGQARALQGEIIKLESELLGMPPDSAGQSASQARLDMLKETGLAAVEAEIEKLNDYQAAYEYPKKSPAEFAQLLKAKEGEVQGVQQTNTRLQKDASDLEGQYKTLQSVLNGSEEEYLVRYIPTEPITVKDIVRGKVEDYKASLAQKGHLELLEEIVQRFIQEPGRFPLWLQYMVIHFSGMRYASAHGSWADPKDLLLGLRTSTVEKDFKKMDDDAVEAMAQERISLYESPNGSTPNAPKLVLSQDATWKQKIAYHLRGLKSPSVYYQRKALFDLRLDEENYDIETMTPTDALEALEAIKDTLPEWMWKEIVKLTDLRVQEVNDPNWEKLTPEEEEQRNEAKYAELRAIMNKWKQDNLTGWREEHDRSNRLIVTRSVCNEVAEQIQHLRGYSPPGGLTAKAPWYMKNESEKKIKGTPGPYFVKPDSEKDYNVGASILWLLFVNELPNPWRVAQPLQTKEGDSLIPAEFKNRRAGSTGSWVYREGDVITRTRSIINEKKQRITQQQWLRWIHEATVAEVTETVDGPTILTFETALPYDDPRMSAVGVFKRDLDDLLFNGGEDAYNGSFVGYLPEGQVPASDLAEMLDWNHILRRQVMTPAEMEAYQKKYVFRS